MTQAKQGDTVRVHYTGRLADQSIFDSSREREPLEFTLGGGQVIPGFEEAVLGLTPGESRTNTIPADQAYGPYNDEMVVQVERNQFPPHIVPSIGQQLQLNQGNGSGMIVTVTEVSDDFVTLDANHPLAGRDLTFEIELVEIL